MNEDNGFDELEEILNIIFLTDALNEISSPMY